MIKLIILGDPKAQQRHRHRSVKTGEKEFVMTYDPSAKDKKNFLTVVQDMAPDKPFDEALNVDLYFYMGRPKSHYGTGRNENKLKSSAPVNHTKKPDCDNLKKFCLDALNGIYWRDDSVICSGKTVKVYSERPRTEIYITPLGDINIKNLM